MQVLHAQYGDDGKIIGDFSFLSKYFFVILHRIENYK